MKTTGTRESWCMALLLSVFVAVFFYPVVFRGRVLSANDIAYAFPPFSETAPEGFEKPHNPLLADQPQQFHAYRVFWKNTLRAGSWPRWMPGVCCGHSAVTEIQMQSFHPLTFLALLVPVSVAQTISCLLRTLLGGLGVFLFLRRLALRPLPALLGAIGFSYCSFNIVWLNHPHAAVSVALPWLLWSLERAIRPGCPLPMASRSLPLAVCVFLPIAAGHPNTIVLSALFAALYAAYRLALGCSRMDPENREGIGRGVMALGLGVLLGIGLSAPIVLPLADARMSGLFFFGNRLDAAAAARPLPIREVAASLLFPLLHGSPVTGNDTNLYNFNENSLFMGLTTLLLIVLPLPWSRRRPDALFFFLLGLFPLLTILGVPPFQAVVARIPLLKDNHLQRLTFVTQTAWPLCAAIGFDALLSASSKRSLLRGAWIAVCGLLFLWAFLFLRRSHGAFDGAGLALASALILLALSSAFLLGGTRLSRIAACAFPLVLFLELFFAHADYNPAIPLSWAEVPEPPIVTRIKERSGDSWYRIASVDGDFMPNASLVYDVHDVRGYVIPFFQPYIDFLRHAFYDGQWQYECLYWHCGTGGFADPTNRPLIDLMGIRHVLHPSARGTQFIENPLALPHAFRAERIVPSTGDVARDVELLRQGHTVVPSEVSPPPADEGTTRIRELPASPNRLAFEIESDRDAIVVVNEMPIPGWRARLNGKRTDWFAANHIHIGVAIPPGEHRLDLNFFPASFRAGLWIGVLSAIAGIAWFGFSRLRNIRYMPPKTPRTHTLP